jgi:hypothetical protein
LEKAAQFETKRGQCVQKRRWTNGFHGYIVSRYISTALPTRPPFRCML